MTYCVGSDIAAFGKGEGLDLSTMPSPEEVDAAWCLRCGICYETCPVQAIVNR